MGTLVSEDMSEAVAGAPLLVFPCNGNGVEALGCLGDTYRCIGLVDDENPKQGIAYGLPLLTRASLAQHPEACVLAVPGSGLAYRSRQAIIESLGVEPHRFPRVVHPRAWVSPLATIGHNVLLMAGVVVTGPAVIGDHVCVWPNSVIHHDVRIGPWTLIGANVTIGGRATVGRNCYLGSGVCVVEGVSIGDGMSVAPGTIVFEALPAPEPDAQPALRA